MRQKMRKSLILCKNKFASVEGTKGPFSITVCCEKLKKLVGLPFIYRLKFDALSNIDNFSINSKFPFFNIDKLPIISEIMIGF